MPQETVAAVSISSMIIILEILSRVALPTLFARLLTCNSPAWHWTHCRVALDRILPLSKPQHPHLTGATQHQGTQLAQLPAFCLEPFNNYFYKIRQTPFC